MRCHQSRWRHNRGRNPLRKRPETVQTNRASSRFSQRLKRNQLDGVSFIDGRLTIVPVRATAPVEAEALADRLDAMMPRIRVTELLHEVARETGFLSSFTNLRTGEKCPNGSALLAAILADATNLGLSRMAAASQGVTRDQLVWTQDAYIREDTYAAALATIIDAHHALPIAATWGDGTTSSWPSRPEAAILAKFQNVVGTRQP